MITTRPIEAFEELTYNYGMDDCESSQSYRKQQCMYVSLCYDTLWV